MTSATAGPALSGLGRLAREAVMLALRIEEGCLVLRYPDGRRFRIEGHRSGPEAVFVVHDWAFARRLVLSGDIGLGEGFVAGAWDSPDLVALLELLGRNGALVKSVLSTRPIVQWLQRLRIWRERNSRRGSRRNVAAHYDLGNAFYAAWLDPSMTYSAALFAPGERDLSAAQHRKYARLSREARIGPDHHVLEIGCGWGGFAEFAAREIGCRVTALTVSPAQFAHASERIAAAGLTERVTVALRDYRDERAVYDRIVSIEMLEAVGEGYWPRYYRQLHDRLSPGGLAALQVITIGDTHFDAYRRDGDFVRRYVFPGGMLPSPGALRGLAAAAGLEPVSTLDFGADYVKTLSRWRERFDASSSTIAALGFDAHFQRLWRYYLAYCEAGFRAGTLDVHQIVYARR